MTKQIDILSSETKNTSSNTTNINKEVKQEASLFDKLLGAVTKNSSSEKTDSTLSSSNTNKEEIKKTINSENEVTQNNSKSNETDSTNKDFISQKNSSLLDRLVLEAKKDVVKNPQVLESSKQVDETVNTVKVGQVNIDSEEINTKTELKINEPAKTDKTIETKDITKNSEISQANQQSQQTKTPLVNQVDETVDTVKVAQVNIDSEEINTKLGKDLASLNKENIVNEKINISKDEIESLVTKQKEEPKSLMDSLIEKTKTLKNQTSLSDEDSKTIKNTNTANNSKDVISNIYLSSQRNNINNSALSNKAEAINSVKNATTAEEIEVNAKKLDLNVKDISLETKAEEIKKDTINLIDRKSTLDKIILNNNARHNEVTNLITKSVQASKAILEDSIDIDNEVSLNVNPVLAQSIQTKIIGARQQMSSMMSDIARQMYENYKPPVTAFRINLTPGALGHIAIIMKSDKDSGINISLNISNSATLDAFVDSQNSLRNALNKTFEEGTEFNLDFGSSDQNNNKSNEREDTNQAFDNQSNTQSILESREKNLESEDRNLDYM